MGGGGLDIHYGIYRSPKDGVFESSKATNKKLLADLDWTCPVRPSEQFGLIPYISTRSSAADLGNG